MPELSFQASVMSSVSTGDISRVLQMGANAAQAAAQPLAAANRSVHGSATTEVSRQALAVFQLNGVVTTDVVRAEGEASEWERFSESGGDSQLMRSGRPFIRELACLHGVAPQVRHPEALTTAFDHDEDIAFDTLNVLNQSGSV
jgi:hypothetical protein